MKKRRKTFFVDFFYLFILELEMVGVKNSRYLNTLLNC